MADWSTVMILGCQTQPRIVQRWCGVGTYRGGILDREQRPQENLEFPTERASLLIIAGRVRAEAILCARILQEV